MQATTAPVRRGSTDETSVNIRLMGTRKSKTTLPTLPPSPSLTPSPHDGRVWKLHSSLSQTEAEGQPFADKAGGLQQPRPERTVGNL